jgi:hypothetical protein
MVIRAVIRSIAIVAASGCRIIVATRMGNKAASASPQRNCFLETIRYGSVNERVNDKALIQQSWK